MIAGLGWRKQTWDDCIIIYNQKQEDSWFSNFECRNTRICGMDKIHLTRFNSVHQSTEFFCAQSGCADGIHRNSKSLNRMLPHIPISHSHFRIPIHSFHFASPFISHSHPFPFRIPIHLHFHSFQFKFRSYKNWIRCHSTVSLHIRIAHIISESDLILLNLFKSCFFRQQLQVGCVQVLDGAVGYAV